MAKKNDIVPVRYIQTPYNFTHLSKNLTLLQQNVLVRVMDHLQKYMKEFYESDLKDSKERPMPLFSKDRKAAGLEPIKIDYKDLGVEANNFPACEKAIREVMQLNIHEDVISETTGKPVRKFYNIFPEGEQEIGSTYAVFNLNKTWLDRIFDMRYGYISHPVDIASIGKVENMPMIYYFLRHATRNWQTLKAKVTLKEIKEYLGMRTYDVQGMLVEEKYQKYSQFKQYVLDRAQKEIDQLAKKGRVDITFTYTSLYRGGRKTGNPDLIEFDIKKVKAQQAEPQPAVSKHVIETQEEKNAKVWQSFLYHYNGKGKAELAQMTYLGVRDGVIFLEAKKAVAQRFEDGLCFMTPDEKKDLLSRWVKHTGHKICNVQYKLQE